MKLKSRVSSTLNKSLCHKTTRCCCKRIFSSSVFFAVVATLSACGSPSQTENQPMVESAANIQMAETEATSAQANTPSIQTNQQSTPLLQNVSATVYKDANCGCCGKWVNYAEQEGMQANIQHPKNLAIFKDRYGVPQEMRSCHTTVTADGYVFEGHIPAKFIAQFLDSPPAGAVGLAVPSMPVGSPGMEYQGKFLPYKVMQINNDGSTQIYADIKTPSQQS